jgi:LAS superfamily LD-carboxypeptidase LdcB
MKKWVFISLLALSLAACGKKKAARPHDPSTSKDNSNGMKTYIPCVDSLHITKKFVTGQFDYHNRNDFVRVPDKYTNKEVYLQKRTYHAFLRMADSARKAGIKLIIVSGTRNFNYQKAIWDRKWQNSDSTTDLGKAEGILLYSSMPMTSRHHWGTDIDLNHLSNSYFEKGAGKKEYEWLKTHANHFGFYQPYTSKKNGRTGYDMEKWHWSYLPLAARYLNFYDKHITNADITGFKGSWLAGKIDMVGNYVDGVSEKVKAYDERCRESLK